MIPSFRRQTSMWTPKIRLDRMRASRLPRQCALSTRRDTVTDDVSSWFAQLRWQAANAITASLTKHEREKLLNVLAPSLSQPAEKKTEEHRDQEQHQQPSIAELIAQAKTEEAQKYEKQWQRERDILRIEAEEAAQKRVEHDLKVQRQRMQQFQKWHEQVQVEKQKDDATATITTNQATVTTEMSSIKPESSADQEPASHPVLGRVVVDLGYKRIHLASVQALQAIPVWKKQRIYRHERAKVMAADKMKSLHLGLPGVIGLYEDRDGQLSILDGQHRVGMLSILQAQNADLDYVHQILVEVYPQPEDKEDVAKELFEEINKAEPVKLLDMPGVAKAVDRKALTDGAARIQARYPGMFSASQRCRAPHLNIDNLRDALFGANILSKHGLKSGKAVEAWLEGQNVLLKEKYLADATLRERIPQQAWQKAQTFDFYLGLDSSWLYN